MSGGRPGALTGWRIRQRCSDQGMHVDALIEADRAGREALLAIIGASLLHQYYILQDIYKRGE